MYVGGNGSIAMDCALGKMLVSASVGRWGAGRPMILEDMVVILRTFFLFLQGSMLK